MRQMCGNVAYGVPAVNVWEGGAPCRGCAASRGVGIHGGDAVSHDAVSHDAVSRDAVSRDAVSHDALFGDS